MPDSNFYHDVARRLATIEAVLERNGEDMRTLTARLLGDDDGGDGGMIGAHNRRLMKLEAWFIRVTTGIVVWTFMTGSGPVSLATVLKLIFKL